MSSVKDGSVNKYELVESGSGEPTLTYVMVVSQFIFWAWFLASLAFGNRSHWWVFAAHGFHWLWAIKNIVVGPIKKDAGVITWLPASGSGVVEVYMGGPTLHTSIGTAVGCLLVALNFALPLKRMLSAKDAETRYAGVSEKMGKSLFFAKVFFMFCISNEVLWWSGLIAVAVQIKSHSYSPSLP